MSQINAEFGRGNDLNSYRGTTWYTDAGGSGTFSTGAISYTDFYGKRVSSPVPSTIDVLVVAGGGSSGYGWVEVDQPPWPGGGGGAGGMCEQSGRSISAGTTYTITVGAGGSPATSQVPPRYGQGNNGSNSIFDTITSIGGGGGGPASTYTMSGAPGGSGGGAGNYAGNTGYYPAGYPGRALQGNSGGATGYGNDGGSMVPPGWGEAWEGGPCYGGGAGAPGNTTGAGRANSITGSSVTYAKGGGYDGLYGLAGATNSGNGGSAVWYGVWNGLGVAGGSGVVIVRYPNTYSTATVTGSPTYTNTGGYHVYKFTGSGTIRW